jgi:hypothetical protein
LLAVGEDSGADQDAVQDLVIIGCGQSEECRAGRVLGRPVVLGPPLSKDLEASLRSGHRVSL